MNLLGLCEELWGVVLCKEQVVDRCSDFDSQPFGEFLILERQVLNCLLLFDLGEELCKTIAFNNVTTKSIQRQCMTFADFYDLLFHVNIEFCSTFLRNLVELLLFLHSLLIHCPSPLNVNHIRICWSNARKRKEFLYRVCISDLWVAEQSSKEGPQGYSLSFTP